MNSFDLMYNTFGIHSQGAKKHQSQSMALSTGINWIDSNPVIMDLLKLELESGLSHKSYGRSHGFKFVTDVLSEVENEIGGGAYKPTCVVTNGTADASHLIFSTLTAEGYLKEGDDALMINHGFPFYNNLCEAFKINFKEFILPKKELVQNQSYLAPIEQVIRHIEETNPKMVFLLVPNNPFGEEYSESDLEKLNKCITEQNTTMIIDRVCLMPWNDYGKYNRAFATGIRKGNVYIVDSFSKGESVGGLRIGYMLTNAENEELYMKNIRTKCLNPRTFGTVTMAIVRTFSHMHYSGGGLSGSKFGRLKPLLDKIVNLDYPVLDKVLYDKLYDSELYEAYIQGTVDRKAIMENNFNYAREAFREDAMIPMYLHGGFSSTLMTEKMVLANEKEDVIALSDRYNVGIITENAFRTTEPAGDEHYFVRIGLPMPEEPFRKGIDLMKEFYLLK